MRNVRFPVIGDASHVDGSAHTPPLSPHAPARRWADVEGWVSEARRTTVDRFRRGRWRAHRGGRGDVLGTALYAVPRSRRRLLPFSHHDGVESACRCGSHASTSGSAVVARRTPAVSGNAHPVVHADSTAAVWHTRCRVVRELGRWKASAAIRTEPRDAADHVRKGIGLCVCSTSACARWSGWGARSSLGMARAAARADPGEEHPVAWPGRWCSGARCVTRREVHIRGEGAHPRGVSRETSSHHRGVRRQILVTLLLGGSGDDRYSTPSICHSRRPLPHPPPALSPPSSL